MYGLPLYVEDAMDASGNCIWMVGSITFLFLCRPPVVLYESLLLLVLIAFIRHQFDSFNRCD